MAVTDASSPRVAAQHGKRLLAGSSHAHWIARLQHAARLLPRLSAHCLCELLTPSGVPPPPRATSDSQHGPTLCIPSSHQQRHAKGPAHARLPLFILSEAKRQVAQALGEEREDLEEL